jgi:hypothetical protein
MDSLKFHPGPPCPTLPRPAGRLLLKWLFQGWPPRNDGLPTGRVACSRLLSLWTPHAIRLCPAPQCAVSKEVEIFDAVQTKSEGTEGAGRRRHHRRRHQQPPLAILLLHVHRNVPGGCQEQACLGVVLVQCQNRINMKLDNVLTSQGFAKPLELYVLQAVITSPAVFLGQG